MGTQLDVTYRPAQIVTLARKIRAEVIPPSKSYARFLAITMHKPGATQADRDMYWNAVRGALIEALGEHKQAQRGGPANYQLQPEMADFIADALRDLCEGEPNPLFQPRTFPGGTGNRRKRRHRRHIDRAVDYITAADLEVVADPRARTTVAECYGVSRQQVYRWVQAAGNGPQRAKQLSEKYRDIEARSQNNAALRIITKLMKISADDYRSRREKRVD